MEIFKKEEVQQKPKPIIDRETQIAIMDFFFKTSVPRILKEKEKETS